LSERVHLPAGDLVAADGVRFGMEGAHVGDGGLGDFGR
jgi:hypothetical protein